MADRRGRFPALILITVLLLAGILMLAGAPDERSASAEPPSKATKYYLGATFTMNIDWITDDLWIVLFVQNHDKYPGPDVGNSEYNYDYMEVANSYMFPIDGNQYSSNIVRRPLVELFTATDCTAYCPSAEESLHKIVENRGINEFSLIEWHKALQPGADPYETGASGYRFDLYNVTATPTVIFDGQLGRRGGDSSVNSPMLVNAYNNQIDRFSVYDPYVTLMGSASTNGDQCSFNVSFEVPDALPMGTWALKAIIVEDLNKDHNGATMRYTARRTFSKTFENLQADHPSIILDEEETYSGINVNKVMGDLDLYWDATDPQDGSTLTMDIEYSQPGMAWESLVQGISNTDSYSLDTTTIEDGKYSIRIVAEDSDGNRVMSANSFKLTINNPDFPEIELISPMAGDSLFSLAPIKWNSSDDEDIITDLLVKISIRNSTEIDWSPITFNTVTLDDFIANTGTYNLNTKVFPDLNTYQLKIELKDRDDMVVEVISDVFEIYNNDQPRAFIYSPIRDEVVTGSLNIEWKIEDEEDEAWDLVDEMMGNFSVLKKGEDEWLTLFLDHLDSAMAAKTFETSELMGDGDYTLKFTVTDTRGKSSTAEREFSVYDPDPPEFLGQVEGPADTSDLKEDTLHITWSAHDPDDDEILTFTIEISPAELDDWTVVETNVIGNSYDLDLTQFEQGRYKLRLTAQDDSGLSSPVSIEYGPFYYNAPDPPEITWIEPYEGFNGTIEDEVYFDNVTYAELYGVFFFWLEWSGSDPEGDNITYSLYWKIAEAEEWNLLAKDLVEGEFTNTVSVTWNITALTDGSYMLKVVARDSSEKHLETESVLGPFFIDNPFDPPIADDDDDIIGDDDDGSGDKINIGLVIGIAVGSIVVVIILVIVILVVLNKTTGKRPDETPVIPTQKDVDLSIPDFDRGYAPQTAVTSGQMVSQGPYAGVQQQPLEPAPTPHPVPDAAPPPVVEGQVSWESGGETVEEPQVEGSEETAPEQEEVPQEQAAEEEAQETPAPMAPPPAMPEIPQAPPPLPPQE